MILKPIPWGEPFDFSPENKIKIEIIFKRYPQGRRKSAVMPLLDLAQRQCNGWLPQEAMEKVAAILGLTPLYVWEVATFYTMYHLRPVGTYHVQVCRTASCYLKGAANLTKICQKKLGLKLKEKDADGMFSLEEVECLGACVNAPVVQINDDYYEDLTPESFEKILEDIQLGHHVEPAEVPLSTAPKSYHPTKAKTEGEAPKIAQKTENKPAKKSVKKKATTGKKTVKRTAKRTQKKKDEA